jgi:hypothetical protein
MKMSRKACWILLFPSSAVIFFVANLLATLFFNVLNFAHPQLAYGKDFIDYVLAPGIAAYYCISWPIERFNNVPAPPEKAFGEGSYVGRSSVSTDTPRNVLSTTWIIVYGIAAGHALFNSIWPQVMATLVATTVVIYFFDE